ncbi:MAG: endonuclease/exonuclease/phosphatase family protein [Rubripirellula sp.]
MPSDADNDSPSGRSSEVGCDQADDVRHAPQHHNGRGRSWTERQLRPCTRLLMLGLGFSTLATLLAEFHWFADLLANLRVQLVFGILGLIVLSLACRYWRAVAIAIVLLAIHLPWFAAAFPRAETATPGDDVITITVVNVLTRNRNYDGVIEELSREDPDVFAVLELSPPLASALNSELGVQYPHRVLRPLATSNFGIGLYSKHPLRDEVVFASQPGVDSIAATLDIGSQAYRVIATHPLPPMNHALFECRNAQLQHVADRIASFQANAEDVPVVLVGDLNLTPWSPWFSKFQNQADLARGIDRFTLQPTWYRFNAFPFGLVLDHCLADKTLICQKYEIGDDIGSDHRSITVQLELSTAE